MNDIESQVIGGMDLSNIPTDDGSMEDVDQDFLELSQLGYLSETVSWCGHRFLIKTLNIGEEIAAGKLVKQSEGTLAQYKTTLATIVAASVIAIDGVPFLPYLGDEDLELYLLRRFNTILRWYWPLVEFLAEEHAKLAERVSGELGKLQKKLSVSMRTSSDMLEFLKDKEPSEVAS